MGGFSPRVVLLFAGSILSLSVGEVLLKVGMARLDTLADQRVAALARAAATNGPLWLGMVLMIVQFTGMLSLFKCGWDASVVVPVFGLNFALIALIGAVWLHEPVNLTRWLGILAIMIGVALVAQSSKGAG